MSEYKTKILLGGVLAVVIALGLSAAAISVVPQLGGSATQTQRSAVHGAQSLLIVQLTDPPIVPKGTTSLNLTYTAINLLVAEPSIGTSVTTSISGSSTVTSTITSTIQNGKVTTQTVTIAPNGGSATVNLLKLQNISETLGSAKLPAGSTIYSISFTVSSISIAINGTTSPVTLATGSTLLVTLVRPAVLQGTNAVLLELNPTVIDTSSGYQLIPSSIGVMKPQSEVSDQDEEVGSQQQLSNQDHQDISSATGRLAANLLVLSVSGNTTTVTVQVNNTGNSEVRLVAVGVQGNFTQNTSCMTDSQSTQRESDGSFQQQYCRSPNEVVFVPNVTTTSTTTSSLTAGNSCASSSMVLMSSSTRMSDESGYNQLLLAPGQCVILTFSGKMSIGEFGSMMVPSMLAGQTYLVHVIASNEAAINLNCTLPLSSTSCKAVSFNNERD